MKTENAVLVAAVELLLFIIAGGIIGGVARLGLRRPLRWREILASLLLGLPALSILSKFAWLVVDQVVYLVSGTSR